MDINKSYVILHQTNPDQMKIDGTFQADDEESARTKAKKMTESKYPARRPFYVLVKVIDVKAGRQRI